MCICSRTTTTTTSAPSFKITKITLNWFLFQLNSFVWSLLINGPMRYFCTNSIRVIHIEKIICAMLSYYVCDPTNNKPNVLTNEGERVRARSVVRTYWSKLNGCKWHCVGVVYERNTDTSSAIPIICINCFAVDFVVLLRTAFWLSFSFWFLFLFSVYSVSGFLIVGNLKLLSFGLVNSFHSAVI